MTRRIAWATDIHLDSAREAGAARFCEKLIAAECERLLLGGDIAVASSLEPWLCFLDERLGIPIDFVLGNHDYYGGDVHGVREVVRNLDSPTLSWLPESGVVELTATTALVGHGGWGDARHGDFAGSEVVLTDYEAILDLVRAGRAAETPRGARKPLPAFYENKPALARLLGELGDEAAATVKPALEAAAAQYERVYFLTHVPPFRGACWHQGRISDDHWLPSFTCRAIGELLREVAAANEECEILVLCGHTHGGGEYRTAHNLLVWTQEAEYGRPAFRVIEM